MTSRSWECERWTEDFSALRAERDALKAALRELVDGVDIYLHNGPFDSMKILGPAMRKARALLAAPEDAA